MTDDRQHIRKTIRSIIPEHVAHSEYRKLVRSRYSTFDSGKGKEFEEGKLTLEDLAEYIGEGDQLEQISGRQEYYENLINRYVL